jgi:hypothetical protein
VLVNSKPEVAGSGEILFLKLILLHLKPSVQDLVGFESSDGNMYSNFLITTNTERTNSISSLAEDRFLIS